MLHSVQYTPVTWTKYVTWRASLQQISEAVSWNYKKYIKLLNRNLRSSNLNLQYSSGSWYSILQNLSILLI